MHVLETLQVELGPPPGLQVRSYALTGLVRGRAVGMGQKEAEAGVTAALSLEGVGGAVCNERSFAVEALKLAGNGDVSASAGAGADASAAVGWTLSPRDGAFVSGSAFDWAKYKPPAAFRPLPLRARVLLSTSRAGPGAQARVRVEVEMNPAFAGVGGLEVRVLLTPLCLLSQVCNYDITACVAGSGGHVHALNREALTLAWSVSVPRPASARVAVEAVLTLALRGAAADAPTPEVAFPPSLPLKISAAFPFLLSPAVVRAWLPGREGAETSLEGGAKADFFFAPAAPTD